MLVKGCQVIAQRTTLLCAVFAWCGAGLTGHEAALAQPSEKSILEQFANPIPPDCHIPPRDLEPPDLPPGTNKVVRIVTLNGYVQPELSTGSFEDMRNAKIAVEPKPGGYGWGEKCRGRVKFFFLSEVEQPSPKIPPSAGGSTSQPPPSAGGSSTTQGSSGASGQTSSGSSGSPPSSTVPVHTDPSPTNPPPPTPTTPPSSRTPVQTGGSDPCEPPPATPPRTVLVPEVKFLVERCTAVTSTCSATPKRRGGASDCVNQCLQWSAPAIQGAPGEKETIGLILPGGDRIEWGRGVAEGAQFTRFQHPYQGDDTPMPVLELAQFSNGVNIREVEAGKFSTEVPVSLLPVWSSSTTAVTKPKVTSTSTPVPIIKLNGSEQFKHLWYTDDNGQFTLSFANNAKAPRPSGAASSQATGGCPSGGNMVVEITLKTDQSFTGQPFFAGVETQTFTLAPQKTKELTGTLKKFLDSIMTEESVIHSDILFGAQITIKVWEEDKPGALLKDVAFGVYRFLDVADDEHTGGVVEMARTLADGPDHVVRLRELAMQVHPDAAVTFDSDNPEEINVREQNGATSFRFDPKKRDRREQVSGTVVLSANKDKRRVGSLHAKGSAEPQNRVVFDVTKFSDTLRQVMERAKDPRNAQQNPPSLLVHPALVPSAEWTLFETEPDRVRLAEDIKKRMEWLWNEAGLMPGIRWFPAVDPENTVDLAFELRENNHPNGGFARGVTPGAADNLAPIREIVRGKDQWNKAELAFRLSRAINLRYRHTIKVWPDSLLEEVPPSPLNPSELNKVILTKDRIVNAFAKTMVHEIGHSWSLDHPAHIEPIADKDELQKLVLKDVSDPSSVETFQLSFHGQTTELLSFYQEDPKAPKQMIKMGSQPISDALLKLSSIGFANYETQGQGAFVYGCRFLLANAEDRLKDFAPSREDPSLTPEQLERKREAHNRQREADRRVINLCKLEPAAVRDRTFYVEFTNHLTGANLNQLEIIPSAAGTITTVHDGEKSMKLKTKQDPKGSSVHVPAKIDGYKQADLYTDLMLNLTDVEGKLRFQEGISLEPLKMALALNYTKAEVQQVVDLYLAMDKAYTRWGKAGFE